jgi:hypothetical protein
MPGFQAVSHHLGVTAHLSARGTTPQLASLPYSVKQFHKVHHRREKQPGAISGHNLQDVPPKSASLVLTVPAVGLSAAEELTARGEAPRLIVRNVLDGTGPRYSQALVSTEQNSTSG